MARSTSCCEGVWGSADAAVEIIRPTGGDPSRVIPVLESENTFGWGPLAMACYPAIALILPTVDEPRLKSSLARALEAVPTAAGRFCNNGRSLALNGAGVPFQVVQSGEAQAPEVLEERQLLDFAEFPNPGAVYRGKAPVMAVKLTIFKDNSAVLCMSRSHMLFDGTSAWTFLAFWSALARGEDAKVPVWDKEQVIQLIPDEEETLQLGEKEIGKKMSAGPHNQAIKAIFTLLSKPYDMAFRQFGVSLHRDRLYFSDGELAALKSLATPKIVEPGKDNWVSTQEAFCAYLIHTLGHHLLPANCQDACKLLFFLDPRKSLGLPANLLLGSGMVVMTFKLEKFMSLTLTEIAFSLHEALSGKESSNNMKARWRLASGAQEIGRVFDLYSEFMSTKGCKLVLGVNNSSKRQLPDFGGGRCEKTVTNAGPSIFLPAKGGMEVFLDSQVFSKTGCSKAQKQKALEALRSELPRL